MKKTLLTIGTSAMAFAPLATVVACGSNEDTSYNNVVEILVPWNESSNEARMNAVDATIASYNAEKAGSADYLEVRSRNVEGYGDVIPSVESKLANERNDVSNLAITYPDTLGTVAYYGRELNLNTSEHIAGNEDAYGVDRERFEGFAGVNDEIEGLVTPDGDEGYYSTSFGRSADLLYMNKPLLAVITAYMADDGATFEGTTFAEIMTMANYEQGEIDAIKLLHPAAGVANTKTYTEDVFTDFTAFLEFITDAKAAITSEFPLAQIDSITNTLYQYTFDQGNGSYGDFVFNTTTTDGKREMNYHLGNTSHVGYQSMNTLYDAMKGAIEAGALINRYGEGYGANRSYVGLVDHEMAFGMGSTSQFNNFYDEDGDADTTVQLDDLETMIQHTSFDGSGTDTTTLVQGAGIVGISTTEVRDTASRKFIEWFYNPASKVTVDHNGKAIVAADQISPAHFVSNAANYVYTGDFANAETGAMNQAQLATFNALEGIIADDTYTGFENPAGRQTDSLRAGLGDVFGETLDDLYAGTSKPTSGSTISTFEEFLAELKTGYGFAF